VGIERAYIIRYRLVFERRGEVAMDHRPDVDAECQPGSSS